MSRIPNSLIVTSYEDLVEYLSEKYWGPVDAYIVSSREIAKILIQIYIDLQENEPHAGTYGTYASMYNQHGTLLILVSHANENQTFIYNKTEYIKAFETWCGGKPILEAITHPLTEDGSFAELIKALSREPLLRPVALREKKDCPIPYQRIAAEILKWYPDILRDRTFTFHTEGGVFNITCGKNLANGGTVTFCDGDVEIYKKVSVDYFLQQMKVFTNIMRAKQNIAAKDPDLNLTNLKK